MFPLLGAQVQSLVGELSPPRPRGKAKKKLLLIEFRLPWWLSGKESACQCRRHEFYPWVRKIPWRRKWQPTPVFLLGKSHGQKSLVGYSPWGHKELDTT